MGSCIAMLTYDLTGFFENSYNAIEGVFVQPQYLPPVVQPDASKLAAITDIRQVVGVKLAQCIEGTCRDGRDGFSGRVGFSRINFSQLSLLSRSQSPVATFYSSLPPGNRPELLVQSGIATVFLRLLRRSPLRSVPTISGQQ